MISAAFPVHRYSLPQLLADGGWVALAYYRACRLRFENGFSGTAHRYGDLLEATIFWVVPLALVVLAAFGQYQRLWTFVTQRDYEGVTRQRLKRALLDKLSERYDFPVPPGMVDLLRLPGVARKTANVVQGNAFQHVEGVVVDTHVGRITRRLGLTIAEDPPVVERDLMAVIDQPDWLDFSHLLILEESAHQLGARILPHIFTLAARQQHLCLDAN